MSVSTTSSRSGPYNPTGLAVAFPFDFFALSTDEIDVVIDGETVSNLLYTVDMNDDQGVDPGGTVVFSIAPTGSELWVEPNPLFTQEADFANAGPFLLETVTQALDRAAARDIRLKDLVDRSIKVPPGEIVADLPSAADRAGKLLAFDGSGAPVAAQGELIIITAPTVSPELFASAKPSGVVGDGTDDGPAFAAMSDFLNAAGRGVISLSEGAVYYVGGQTLHNPGVGLDGVTAGIYRFFPNTPYIIDVNGCTGPVEIHYNGATIRCLAGAKYGNFNVDGTAWDNGPTYAGDGAASPYIAMLAIRDCTGPIKGIGYLELDGNIKNCTIGGPWAADGSGRQLPMTGLILQGNTGSLDLDPIFSHHHGLDGAIGDGPGLLDTKEQVTIRGIHCANNGRQGFSLVGGNGWRFVKPKFNQTGKDLGTMPYSAPGAGIDFESEGGKWVINITMDDPETIDNIGVGYIADMAGQTQNIICNGGRLIGTTSWAVWPNRPYMRFNYTLIAGALTLAHPDTDPEKATQFFRCDITDDVTLSPTAALYGGGTGYIHFDTGGGVQNILFDECTWTKAKSGGDSVNGSFPTSIDGPGLLLRNNTVRRTATVGNFFLYGIYSGERTKLINTIGLPSPEADNYSMVVVGPSLDSFYFDNGGIFSAPTGRFSASVDKATGDVLGTAVNAGDAIATLTPGTDPRNQRFTGTLTADRAITLATATAKRGSKFRITRTGAGAFNLNVGTGPLKAMATNTWADFEFSGTAWQYMAGGAL